MESIDWKIADASAYVLKNSVHIWKITFSDFSNNEMIYNEILSPEEIQRAARFHFEIDSIRFKATKAFSKTILSRILSIKAQTIKFKFNKHGKPELKGNTQGIHFNISHSGNIGLIAISDIGPIGVDVERYRKKIQTEKIARRFFSPAEVKAYLAVHDDHKEEAFFNCWTRKEAFIKALGLGLAMPLKDFSVALTPGEKAILKEVNNINENATDWFLKNIPFTEKYAAAFAIKGKVVNQKYWRVTQN